jgi:hypothetical protein
MGNGIGVDVGYGSIRGLEFTVRIRVCPTVIPGCIWGRNRIWHRKARRGVCIPLPEHTGRSLLRYPKSRNRALDGGSVVKMVHQLGRGVRY